MLNTLTLKKVHLFIYLTKNTCIAKPREARGGGGGGPIKCQGWKEERIGVNCVAWAGGFRHWLRRESAQSRS